jgi:integrase/recombinase XerD
MGDDEALIATWLHGRSPATRRVYRMQIGKLQRTLDPRALPESTLSDLQRHVDRLAGMAPRSQAVAIASIKSFYAFHVGCGSLQLNPAAGLRGVTIPADLAERIIVEADIPKLLYAAPAGRDRAAVALAYGAGLRVSELLLYWRQLTPRDSGQGQVTVTGKGGKTRAVLLPADLWRQLVDLKVNSRPTDPVFPSRRNPSRPMPVEQLRRIIKRAARAAGLSEKISPHWLRHSHASHALDRGAPIQLVRDTLGHASIATTNQYAHARPGASSASYLQPKGEQ